MMKIVSVPDKVLARPTDKVTVFDEALKKLLIDMEETLLAQKDPMGVGLAANQVGVDKSIFVIKKNPAADTKVFINPKILKSVPPKVRAVKKKTGTGKRKKKDPVKLEGCLSIPRIWGPVTRNPKIYVEYQTADGKMFKKWFYGFEATIIQHEIDHLNGIVFTARVLEQKNLLYKEIDGKLKPIDI